MLFAGCSSCKQTVPLYCTGQLLPHVPMPGIETPFGVGCQVCGVLPPIFTCSYCMTTQLLYLKSMAFSPNQALAQGMKLAPVVNATPNSDNSIVHNMMRSAAKGFAVEFGKGVASQLLGAFFGG